jgi:hypothetical protein
MLLLRNKAICQINKNMFIQQGKTNWVMIVVVALIAGAVSGGLVAYINDTVRQTTVLSQSESELQVLARQNATPSPVANTILENNNNQNSVLATNANSASQSKETKISPAILADFSCDTKDAKTGWNICSNKEYNFEFEEPSDFNLVRNLAVIHNCSYETFQEKCPRIDDLILAAENSITCQNNKSCFSNLQPPLQLQPYDVLSRIVVNGIPYCTYKTSDCGAGTCGNEFYHAAIQGKNCFVIHSQYSWSTCEAYKEPGVSDSDNKRYIDCLSSKKKDDETFDKIVSTFKFLK